MPIANCFFRETVPSETLKTVASVWAEEIGVESKDVCITGIGNAVHAGQHYHVLTNLYLPTLWEKADIHRIQLALSRILVNHLGISVEQSFIMTHIVQSGHVVENGKVVQW